MSCVRSLVCVIQHGTCCGCIDVLPMKLNTGTGRSAFMPPGTPSPGCSVHFE